MKRRLLLFDIDGTLLDTGGAGGAALLDAAEEVLAVKREDLPPLDLAGATDGGVIRKLFGDAGHAMEETRSHAFRTSYLGHLQRRLHRHDFPGRLLDGVPELLHALAGSTGASLGLLTGNWRKGAELKLNRFEILGYFADGGFGDDGEDRNLLGPVAVRRMTAAAGQSFPEEEIIVIGDTPKDILCAHAMGARCLAVATGKFDEPALQSHRAWRVVQDFRDTSRIVNLLLG